MGHYGLDFTEGNGQGQEQMRSETPILPSSSFYDSLMLFKMCIRSRTLSLSVLIFSLKNSFEFYSKVLLEGIHYI